MPGRKRRPTSHHPRDSGPTALPAFLDKLPLESGAERTELLRALDAPAPVSIRLNPRKPFPIEAEAVPWCATGRYLPTRPAFTLDPLLHAGAYYVQEASSMLLEKAVQAAQATTEDLLALDLCAAPGGKSTHLLSLLTPGSLLVANEVHPGRRQVLAENCWKQGMPNVIIGGSGAEQLQALPGAFDLILVDAPCSGEGMFRKDEHARRQWSPGLVLQCAATQHGLVHRAWDALAPGGTLIYSTCTWEPDEDEAQVAELLRLGGTCLELDVDPSWGIERSTGMGTVAYRCYPHRLRGEGFFIAAVRKDGTHVKRDEAAVERRQERAQLPWLAPEAQMALRETEGRLHAHPRTWSPTIDRLCAALSIPAPGIPFAEKRGAEWAPHPASALSLALRRDAFPEMELHLDDALRYLRGEALPGMQATGTRLATYRGLPLGWLQGAGSRWNNRWPSSWRVRIQRSDAPPVSWPFR